MEHNNTKNEGKIEFLTNAVTKMLSGIGTLKIGKEILNKKKDEK